MFQNCKHVKDYVDETGRNLWKLYRNRKSIIEEILRKNKALQIDRTVMVRRKRDIRPIDALK